MLKRVFSAGSYTPTPTADTIAFASNTYQAIGALNATSALNVTEVWVNGQAAATDVKLMQFARDSALGSGLTGLATPNADGLMSPATPSTPVSQPLVFVAATTNPQRSTLATSPRLMLTINAFGGIAKWQANSWEGWGIAGVTVSISESSLSALTFTGSSTGNVSSMILYECA